MGVTDQEIQPVYEKALAVMEMDDAGFRSTKEFLHRGEIIGRMRDCLLAKELHPGEEVLFVGTEPYGGPGDFELRGGHIRFVDPERKTCTVRGSFFDMKDVPLRYVLGRYNAEITETHYGRPHVEVLFGEGYQLTKRKELMGGQFASNETVTIVGLKLRAIENVRVLGPVRKQTQVEISATDAIKLGVKAPIRESGKIEGSAPIAVVGPKGALYLDEGCIIAMRHIHMSPRDAMAAGVHDGDIVSVKADNERGTIFNQVKIRVDDSFTLEMHIDTDEANAAKIATEPLVSFPLNERSIVSPFPLCYLSKILRPNIILPMRKYIKNNGESINI